MPPGVNLPNPEANAQHEWKSAALGASLARANPPTTPYPHPKAHALRPGRQVDNGPVNVESHTFHVTPDLARKSPRPTARPRRRTPPALASEPVLEGCAETKGPFFGREEVNLLTCPGYSCHMRALCLRWGGAPPGAKYPNEPLAYLSQRHLYRVQCPTGKSSCGRAVSTDKYVQSGGVKMS